MDTRTSSQVAASLLGEGAGQMTHPPAPTLLARPPTALARTPRPRLQPTPPMLAVQVLHPNKRISDTPLDAEAKMRRVSSGSPSGSHDEPSRRTPLGSL